MRTEFGTWADELERTELVDGRWVRPRPPFPLFIAGGLLLALLILALAAGRALTHGA